MKKGTVYFFTGLAGAGKTTIGGMFYERLKAIRPDAVLIDGDKNRDKSNARAPRDYSTEARRAGAKSVLQRCKGFADQGVDAVYCGIGMYADVRAWCRARGAMRLFKVLRMKRVERKEESFTPRAEEGRQIFPEQICGNIAGDVNVGGGSVGDGNPGGGNVCGGGDADAVDATGKAEADDVPADKTYREIVLRIDKKEAWRVYDRFEEDQITVLADGSFEIRMCCQVDDWVYGVILSFGPSARVLGPGEIIEEIRSRIQAMGKLYEEKGEEKVESEKF